MPEGDMTTGSGEDPAAGLLFVLACPLPGADGGPGYLLQDVGGVSCVIGYTDLTRLVECCGPHQPWLAVPMNVLMADLRDQQLPGPVVNLPLSPEARWGPDGPPWDTAQLADAARPGAQEPSRDGARS